MKVRITVAVVTLALAGAVAASAQVQPPQERINTALARARQVGIPVARQSLRGVLSFSNTGRMPRQRPIFQYLQMTNSCLIFSIRRRRNRYS